MWEMTLGTYYSRLEKIYVIKKRYIGNGHEIEK